MNRHRPVLLLPLLALLLACAAPVKTEYDRQADLDQLQRFAWQAPGQHAVEDPVLDFTLLDVRVARAAEIVLSQRGFQVVDAAEADFLVTYHLIERSQPSGSGASIGIGMGSGGFGTGVAVGTSRSRMQRVILIDILDADSGALLWRGWHDRSERQDRLDTPGLERLLGQVLDRFPPGR
ncbi:DUF4136 domain-containing protein [Natronospira bacteriovora]|uniref:DUF4136 domain-containing protein n=1 Tax=Natronospira bacteriovora TaxID=3069753 RepID=A0ABU0WBN0_9GAMM|nr:DUF4136 domain-containing protein [Natronospira sp. AB-CW4]MDQ2070870.1 DUF4136 domain-containing protein [Natronospira sp. AB-CW4]